MIRNRYVTALHLWNAAFTPLYLAAQRAKEDKVTYLQASSLRALYLWIYCDVLSASFSDYSVLHVLEPHFREMVDHTVNFEAMTSSLKQKGVDPFVLEAGPVPVLFVVATKSRCRETRKRARELLARSPRRDGVWDSRACYAVSEWNDRLEQEYEDAKVPAEERWEKLRDRETIFDEKEWSVSCGAEHFDPVSKQWYHRTDVITW